MKCPLLEVSRVSINIKDPTAGECPNPRLSYEVVEPQLWAGEPGTADLLQPPLFTCVFCEHLKEAREPLHRDGLFYRRTPHLVKQQLAECITCL